jgi:hypothetical protein
MTDLKSEIARSDVEAVLARAGGRRAEILAQAHALFMQLLLTHTSIGDAVSDWLAITVDSMPSKGAGRPAGATQYDATMPLGLYDAFRAADHRHSQAARLTAETLHASEQRHGQSVASTARRVRRAVEARNKHRADLLKAIDDEERAGRPLPPGAMSYSDQRKLIEAAYPCWDNSGQ